MLTPFSSEPTDEPADGGSGDDQTPIPALGARPAWWPPSAQERTMLRLGGWTSPAQLADLLARCQQHGYWLHRITGGGCRCEWCVPDDGGKERVPA